MKEVRNIILTKLMRSNGLRFNQIKEEWMESSHLLYHLKMLQKDDLVSKEGNLYRISTLGRQIVSNLQHPDLETVLQAQISVMLIIKKADGQMLLQKKAYYPFSNTLGFPSSRIRLEESVQDSVNRLSDELCETQIDFKLLGNIYLRYFLDAKILQKTLYHVFVGNVDDIVLKDQKDFEELEWCSLPSTEFVIKPGTLDVLDMMKNSNLESLITEIDINLNI